MTNLRQPIRAVGSLLANLFVAMGGTYLAQAPFSPYFHFSPPYRTFMLKADFLIAVVASGLGFAVYRRWQPQTSKWLWLVGICWYLTGNAFLLDSTQGSVLENSGGGPTLQDVREWFRFTDPCLRLVFYSVGAFCCSIWLKRTQPIILQADVAGEVEAERIEDNGTKS